MTRKSKRVKELEKLVGEKKIYKLTDAIDLLKNSSKVKFDESVDLSFKTGLDTKKSDQQVRGTVLLPNGTGKEIRVVVFAKGDKADQAKEAGADFVGADELLEKVKGGWTDFDAVITTPDMMREVGKLGKILGPRGLMPTPKAGTVTNDVANAVKEVKAGKVEFKVDKGGVIHGSIGKISFNEGKIQENILAFTNAVHKAKPATAKGIYIQSAFLTSTMGPGLKIDVNSLLAG